MELNISLHAFNGDPLSNLTRYQHLTESLVYLVVTRCYSESICFCSHFGPL
jgi:hypothetical protein